MTEAHIDSSDKKLIKAIAHLDEEQTKVVVSWANELLSSQLDSLEAGLPKKEHRWAEHKASSEFRLGYNQAIDKVKTVIDTIRGQNK